MGNNCNTGRCKPKAKATPKCTVPQAALTINKWSCDYPAGKKCSLVEYDGFVYGLNEDRLECSVLPPPADDGYTRAMDTATAIEWVAKCKGCCDKPEDIHITGFTIDGNTATITTNAGTYTQTITHPAQPADVYIDDIRISDDGKSLIYHYTNGDEVTKPHPGVDAPATTFTESTDDATGEVTLSVNGAEQKLNLLDPSLFPHVSVHNFNNPTPTLSSDPLHLEDSGQVTMSGGATVDLAAGTWTLPKDGEYNVWLRVLAEVTNINNKLNAPEKIKINIIDPDGNSVMGIKYEELDFLYVAGSQGKREINVKNVTKTLKAGTYHIIIDDKTGGKVNINSVMVNMDFQSNPKGSDAN